MITRSGNFSIGVAALRDVGPGSLVQTSVSSISNAAGMYYLHISQDTVAPDLASVRSLGIAVRCLGY